MKHVNGHLLSVLLMFLVIAAVSASFAQITPYQDSYNNSATPAVNYGAATFLSVVNSTSSIQSAYIQFDLSPVPTGYTGSNVAKATLKLYVNSVTKAGSFNVVLVNGSWSEKTITSGLAPALGSTIAASVPLTTAKVNDYILIDVTSAVDGWLNGTQPNDGLALVANSPLSASFDSKENLLQGHSAELDIVFTSGSGGGITGITTASGSGLTGGGNSGTLNLSLLKTCSANQVLQWKSNAWVCSSAGTGTISGVTAGTGLTGGGTGGVVTLSLDTTKVPQLNTANNFTGNQNVTGNLGVNGSLSATNAAIINAAPNATAIYGFASASTGAGWGVAGSTNSNGANAFGVYGAAVANSGSASGVYGSGSTGVKGLATVANGGPGGSFTGYSAQSNSGQVATGGVVANGGSGDTILTYGADGVLAKGGNGIGGGNGVEAYGGSGNGQTSSSGAGVYGWGGNGSTGGAPGVYGMGGWSSISNGSGGWFVGAGVSGGQGGDGIDAYAGSGYAGVFHGDVNITGNLSAATKNFKIDHPLDPANKFLVHASVESSELMNIYSGNVLTDAQGDAAVSLPDWFEAENTDFRYQLTVLGQFAQAIVANEIANHQFQIKTSAPNVKVSWQVTAVRQDAYARAHPLVVEEQKDEHLRGYFIHPELHGAPSDKQLEWARHPAAMENMKARQAKLAVQH